VNSHRSFPGSPIAVTNLADVSTPGQQEDLAEDQDPESPGRFKRWEGRTAQKALNTAKNLAATLLAQANPQQVKKFVLHLFELLPLGDKEKLEGIVRCLVDFLDLVGVKLPVGEITALLLPLGMSNLSAAEITTLLAAIGGLPGLAVLGLNPMTTGLVVLVALAFAAGAGISEIWHLVKDSLG